MGAQQVADRFAELYGAAPEGVWAAPGRVNLIGEHTDYNDGFVMPFALPHQAVAAVSPPHRRRPAAALRTTSGGGVVQLGLADLAPGTDRQWTAYPAGVVWALREAGHEITGADVHLSSTVPTGAGLSSSAALEVVIALALSDLYGLGLPRWKLARLCQRAENVYVGAPTGIMDQTASACCEQGHALFLDTRDLSQRQIPFDLAAEGLRLLVVDTQVKHAHSGGEYGKRRAGCEGRGPARRRRPARHPVRRPGRGPRPPRRRGGGGPPGPARGDGGPAGRTHGGPPARRRDPRHRPGPHRGPRLAARRLPHLLPPSWTWSSTPPWRTAPWAPG